MGIASNLRRLTIESNRRRERPLKSLSHSNKPSAEFTFSARREKSRREEAWRRGDKILAGAEEELGAVAPQEQFAS
jgi:hypothetical protein